MAAHASPHYPALPITADRVSWTHAAANTPLPRRRENVVVSDASGIYARGATRVDAEEWAGPCAEENKEGQSRVALCAHELAVRNYQPQALSLAAPLAAPAVTKHVPLANDRRGGGATRPVYNTPGHITNLALPEHPIGSSCIASPVRTDLMMYSPISHHDLSIAKLDEVPDMPAPISASRQVQQLDPSYAWAMEDPDFSEYVLSAWPRPKQQPCEASHPYTLWPEYSSSGGRPSTSSSSSSISTPSLSHSPLSTIEEFPSLDYEHVMPFALPHSDIGFLPATGVSSETCTSHHLGDEMDAYYLSPAAPPNIMLPNYADWQQKFYGAEIHTEESLTAVPESSVPSPTKTVELPELHHPRPWRPYVPPWQHAAEFRMEEFVTQKPRSLSPPQGASSDDATSLHAPPPPSAEAFYAEPGMEEDELDEDEDSEDEMDVDEDWEFDEEDLGDDDQTISSASNPNCQWALQPACAPDFGSNYGAEPSWTTRTLPPHSLLCQPLKNPPCFSNPPLGPPYFWAPSNTAPSFTAF